MRGLQIISGHKTRSVFDRYNIADDKGLRQEAAKTGTRHEELVTPAVTLKVVNLHEARQERG